MFLIDFNGCFLMSDSLRFETEVAMYFAHSLPPYSRTKPHNPSDTCRRVLYITLIFKMPLLHPGSPCLQLIVSSRSGIIPIHLYPRRCSPLLRLRKSIFGNYILIIEPLRDETSHEMIKENKQDANETRQRP